MAEDGPPAKEQPSKTVRLLKNIAAVMAVLVSISGATVAIIKDWVPFLPHRSEGKKQEPRPVSLASCLSLGTRSPNVMPHYLLNSVGSKDFPYWIKLVGVNECNKKLLLTVSFYDGRNVLLKEPVPQSEPLTIEPGAFDEAFSPSFDLASPDAATVKIFWRIEDEEGTRYHEGRIESTIVPPNTIAWDLQQPKEPEGMEAVDKSYLMASLSAWTMKPPRAVAEVSSRCRRARGEVRVHEEAIEACYDHLFGGEDPVAIIPQPIKFPDGLRQAISPPVASLRLRSATSLEAALLLAAVLSAGHRSGVDPDLAMIVAPADEAALPERKTVFLAWKPTGGPWRAIDMMRAGRRSFAENSLMASERVNRIFASEAKLSQLLEEKAGYFEARSGVSGVNLRRARSRRGIQPALNV